MKKKKYPDGGKVKTPNNIVNPIDQKVYDWTQSYINSPKYKERLANFWQYPQYVQGQRATQIAGTQFRDDFNRTAYSDTESYPNQINVNQNQLDAINAGRAEAVAHELGHGTNAGKKNPALRLNPLEERYIFDRNKTVTPEIRQNLLQGAAGSNETMSEFLQGPTHDLAPSESKSDIDALRYLMNEQKIYDARTQDLTPELLQKARSNPAINKAFAPKRLFDNFQDKDLIDIMNKVAVNNTQTQPNMAYNGKKMEKGGKRSQSVVDFLASTGRDHSFSSRKDLYKSLYGSEKYTGSAAQNIKLLNALQSSAPQAAPQQTSYPVSTNNPLAPSATSSVGPVSVIPKYEPGPLESGVIVDKGTNMAHILKGGKSVRSFPVLTGQNPNQEDARGTFDQKDKDRSQRGTPKGYYQMTPATRNQLVPEDYEAYGLDIAKLQPIEYPGVPKPLTSGNVAIHTTYNPDVRGKLYNMAADKRYASYGCINCQNPDIKDVIGTFPQGDTLSVIDSRTKEGKAELKRIAGKKSKGGKVKAQYGAVLPEDEELLPIRPNPIQINSGLQNPTPIMRTIGEQWDMQQVGDPRAIGQGLQNPFPNNNPLPIDYNTNNTPAGQLKNNVSDFFRNDPYKNYIPVDASREGPSFYENEYLMNPEDQSVVQSDYTSMEAGTNAPPPKRQGAGVNFSINPGQIISGIFGAVNQAYDRNRGIEENARLKRLRAMNQGYNPNQYGTGSQAIYKDGGKLSSEKAKEMLRDGTANGKKLTKKQKGYFGWVAGGRKAEDGASITPLSGDFTPSPIMQFNGPSHSEGGIPIAFGGKQVEVEGQETAFVDGAGDLNILGNMYIPGTKTKFKSAGKQIAKEEQKVAKQLDKSATLIDESDPYDRFERFSFNSGMMMGMSAHKKQADIEQSKQYLANLQQAMLEAGMGEDTPKAQDGKKVKKKETPYPLRVNNNTIGGVQFLPRYGAAPVPVTEPPYVPATEEELTSTEQALTRRVGDGSMAVRHNNPGNMKFAKWMEKYGAVKGDPGTDGGNFAKFPSVEQGQAAMVNLLKSPTYKNKTVAQAIKTWTGGTPYSRIPDTIKNKKVSDLQGDNFVQLLDTITQGEDSKRYNWTSTGDPVPVGNPAQPSVGAGVNPPGIPYRPNLVMYDPNIPYTPAGEPPVTYRPPITASGIPDIVVPPNTERPPFRNPLRPGQIAPEIFTLATERPEFVPGQTYEPELYQPYQVSFQDRLNENNASFRAISQQLPGNAAALSALAAQKYQADNQVLADEFRTNQGIANQITNQNTQLLNEAERVNIDLTDQQFVRQTQAEANTRENIRNAMSSVAGKLEQNRTETLRYNAYSQMFPQYQANRYGQLEYIPNEDQWFGGGMGTSASADPAQRTRSTYDGTGRLKETVVVDPSEYQRKQMEYDLWKKQMQNKWMISDKVNKGR